MQQVDIMSYSEDAFLSCEYWIRMIQNFSSLLLKTAEKHILFLLWIDLFQCAVIFRIDVRCIGQ